MSNIQAAFSSTGPEPLFEILLEAGFDEAHAKVWYACVSNGEGCSVLVLGLANTLFFELIPSVHALTCLFSLRYVYA